MRTKLLSFFAMLLVAASSAFAAAYQVNLTNLNASGSYVEWGEASDFRVDKVILRSAGEVVGEKDVNGATDLVVKTTKAADQIAFRVSWRSVDGYRDALETSSVSIDDASQASGNYEDNLTVVVSFQCTPAPTYQVNIAEGIVNGVVTANPTEAVGGEDVTLTVTPAEGYELASLSVTGVKTDIAVEVTDGKFTMPEDDVTVNATFQWPAKDMTGLITNWDFTGCQNNNFPGWTIYAPNGGNTWANGNTRVEYWIGTAANGVFDYYQEIDLPDGKYTLTASMWNSTNGEAGAEVNGNAGVYGTSSGVTVFAGVTDDCDNSNLHQYTTEQLNVLDGKLRLGVKNNGVMGARWFGVDWIKLTQIGEVQLSDYEAGFNEALNAAKATLAAEENAVIVGEEKTALEAAIENNSAVAEPTVEAYKAAIETLQTASNNFTAAREAYAAFASTKENYAGYAEKYVYASTEKIADATAAAEAVPTSAADATSKNTTLIAALRAIAESHAIAEGVEGAEPIEITNPSAENGTNGWTTVNGEGSGGSIGVLSNEPWTSADGSTSHKYFDGGNWGANAWDVSLTQDVELEPGKYLLSAIGRASGDVALSLFAGENKVAMPSIGAAGGIFNRGWNITSVEFETDAKSTVTIGVQGVTEVIHNWMSFSDFKLVCLERYYAVNIAEGIENGTVTADPTTAAAGETVALTVTPDEGFELVSLTVTGVKSNEAVIVTDGKFIMPADDVTVNATFRKAIYIETDLTKDFEALLDVTKWVGASGYAPTQFCPAVTTNSGKTVQVCEKYVTSCANTGDVFYQTVSNLTPGIYKIELYGGAAFTFGRGFGSIAFTGDLSVETSSTYQAGDKIEPTAEVSTGVSLTATTSEGTYGGELPIFYATNFPEGASVVTIEGVQVGENGEVTIGMSKTSQSTNWHVIQLKGVTALVSAADLLATAVTKAQAASELNIPAKLSTDIQNAITTYDKDFDTADEYQTAINTLNTLSDMAVGYVPLSEVLDEGAEYRANVPEESPAITAYDEAIASVKGAYDNVVVADIPAAIAIVEDALPAIAKAQTAPGSDMTRAIVNPTINGAAGWTTEKPKGGNGPLLNNSSFEYWAGNASPREEGQFDYYQVIEGLPTGKYAVSAEMYNSLNDEAGAVFAPTSGVYASSSGSEVATLVDVDGTTLTRYATAEIFVKDGTLRLGVKNVELPMAARWFVADNFELTLIEYIVPTYAVNIAEGITNGTVEAQAEAQAGETVELTVTPAEGYELASISVTGVTTDIAVEVEIDDWTGEVSFTMPEDAVTVSATFQEAYVKVSDFAVASTGFYDEEGYVKIEGTFTSEVAGSYAEMFYGDVVYDVIVVPTAGGDPIKTNLVGSDLADGKVYANVPNLAPNTSYIVYVDSVHVWDYITFNEIFTVKAAEGEHLTYSSFLVMPPTEMAVLNVERYVGYGYATTEAEVDFTAAKEFLGVEEITTDMLYIVNPDFSQIKDYAAYDGWFDGDGKAETWGDNTKINVKFFQAIPEGKYTICDMNGADVVDAVYTVRWALVANYKAYVYTINVKFVEEPTITPEIAAEVNVPVVIKSGVDHEGATAAFNVLDVTGPLSLEAISDAAQYIVNVTDGSFVPNSTDGWRDANGDAATWGSGAGMVCAKISNPASGIIDYLGAIDTSYKDGDTYTAKWGFVNTASNTAVILNINITFVTDPTGIDATPAADGVKPDGKYLENGKIVIYKNGNKYDVTGAPMNK